MSEKKRSYSEIKQELDRIMYGFESSAHDDVDTMLKDYEKATKLIRELETYLEKAEGSLRKLKKNT